MNYLELVNRAIQEAGKDQDDLASADFASPPNARMYNRFKGWVNESYAQLQMARDEWEFMSGRATVDLFPAIYVESGDYFGGPIEITVAGSNSGFTGNLIQDIVISGSWDTGDAVAVLYLDDITGDMYHLNETFDETSPGSTTNIFTAKGVGRYDFNLDGQVTDYYNILRDTLVLQPELTSAGLKKLNYIDWDIWARARAYDTGRLGEPEEFTIAPDGKLDFFPRPDQWYTLQFEYTKTFHQMELFDDTPTNIPEAYHMAIVWMTVEKAGMFDRDRAITARAQKELRFYRDRMEKAYMPDLSFEPSRI